MPQPYFRLMFPAGKTTYGRRTASPTGIVAPPTTKSTTLDLARRRSPALCFLVAGFLIAGFLGACTPPTAEEPVLETVEIGPSATAMLVPEGDKIQASRTGTFAGQLPAGYPAGLPAPASSSVVSDSQNSVSFGTDDSVAAVQQELEPELARAGWHQAGGGRFTKNNRTVTISYAASDGRTTITYRY